MPGGNLSPEEMTILVSELSRDEGFIPHAYQDSLGYWTIGIGRLIDKKMGGGITKEEGYYLLGNDLVKTQHDLDRVYPGWRKLNAVRQRVMLNMCFNLGPEKLSAFKTTLAHIAAGNYAGAADSMLRSLWAKQVGVRATRLARMMKTGELA